MRFTSAGDILIPTKAPTDQLSAVQPPKLTTPASAPAPTSAQDDDEDDLELDLDNMNLDDIDTSVSTFFIISFQDKFQESCVEQSIFLYYCYRST